MDMNKLGKGKGASSPPEDNLEIAEGGWQLGDRTCGFSSVSCVPFKL